MGLELRFFNTLSCWYIRIMNSRFTCLLVPVEGEISVIPYTSTTVRDYLGPHYEGIAFPIPNYRLSGFLRSFDSSAAVNKRCTAIYVAEIRGPVILMNEIEDDDPEEGVEYLISLTHDDIPKIFNSENSG